MKARDIIWDFDPGEEVDLPTEIELPEDMDEDEASDYISELTGFCHRGFSVTE